MAGLLDFSIYDDPNQSGRLAFAAGLLNAAGPQTRPVSVGQAISQGLLGGQQASQVAGMAQRRNALTDIEIQQRQMLMQELQRKAAAEQQAQLRRQQFISQLGTPGPGATIMRPETMKPRPVDPIAALDAGFSLDEAQKLAGVRDWGLPEVARTVDTEGDGGSKNVQQLDKFGRPIGAGLPGYVPPQLIDQGDRKTFAKPAAGMSFPMGMSPEARDSSARGWAGHRLAQQRLALDSTQPPRISATAEKAAQDQQKAGRQMQQLLSAVEKARSLLNQGPTASGIGAGADWLGRQFGVTSDSGTTASQLETIAGWMVANVPRMEGPQSNYDVENYKTMAAKVGDRTTPVSERLAALQTLEDLQRKYAEINGTPVPPSAPAQSGGGGGWSYVGPAK